MDNILNKLANLEEDTLNEADEVRKLIQYIFNQMTSEEEMRDTSKVYSIDKLLDRLNKIREGLHESIDIIYNQDNKDYLKTTHQDLLIQMTNSTNMLKDL